MLKIGDRIWLSGGYDMEPPWLEGGDGFQRLSWVLKNSILVSWLSQDLIKKIKPNNLESDIILMQLRYKNALWDEKEHVHILLCGEILSTEFVSKEWFSNNAVWVESHANYKKI